MYWSIISWLVFLVLSPPLHTPQRDCICLSLVPWCLPCLKGAKIKIFIYWTSNLLSDLLKDSLVHNSYYLGASRDFNLYKIYSSMKLSYPRNFASIQLCKRWVRKICLGRDFSKSPWGPGCSVPIAINGTGASKPPKQFRNYNLKY